MSGRRVSQSGGVTLAALLLLAAGCYLALRSWAAVDLVLSPQAARKATSAGAGASAVERARVRDAALAESRQPPRDPFHLPPRTAAPAARGPATAAPDLPPEVRLVLVDQVNPEVQLSSQAGLSGRLKVGQSFEGWTVVSIDRSAVVVVKDGITETLTVRRQQ